MGWEDPLEKGMATHSSVLAWRIPWTEEPGGLCPMEKLQEQFLPFERFPHLFHHLFSLSLPPSLSLSIYIYIHTHTHTMVNINIMVYVYIYNIYIYYIYIY